MQEEDPRAVAVVGEATVAIGEVVRGERGGPGAGEIAAPAHELGRQPREDVHDDVIGEDGEGGARERHRVSQVGRRSFHLISSVEYRGLCMG